MIERLRRSSPLLAIASLAYLPVFIVQYGKAFTDTKLYLGTAPSDLLRNAATAWDSRLFAGYVPHQNIGYLWPSGPYYWLTESLNIPFWIVQRFWIGSLFFLAGWGLWRCCCRFDISRFSSVIGAMAYMLTPFVLSYLTRSSVLLLPWAGLGHLIATTLDLRNPPTNTSRLYQWRLPAILALIVLSVGGINATALLMIAPGPVIVLLLMRRSGEITNRTAIGFVSRVSLLCLAISSWWIAALITQANHGSRVLSFSESVEAVSRTSTASEVLRGMGHWLNYINAHTAIATTSTIQFMANHWLIISGFSLVALAMMGISISRTRASQFASAFVFAGLVLAVGVHPIEDSALFMRPLAENTESFIALALRSSTRAAPLMLLGLAIGLALLLEKLRFSMRIRPLLGLATAGLILFNFAPIRTGSLFDNEMQRDESLPRDFLDAATQLNALGHRGRVLSFPGSEFGIYDWGYTMDPPQIGFIEQPLLTRDLLPLGGNASMDLFYAFDDALQTGTVTARAIAPLSRLLGASDIWLSMDHKSEQYNTVTPEELQALFAQTDQLEAFVKSAGTYLYSVKQPGALAQMKQTIVLIDGSGDGIVSAASAGAISGHEAVLYASNFKDEELAKLLDRSSMIFVTDSNRTQARQWSGSRDSRGATESADGTAIVEEPPASDARLEIFANGVQTPDTQTLVRFLGPTRATASGYGNGLKYFPESRPAMSLDGDLLTAWRVGEGGNAIDERITVSASDSFSSVSLVQPMGRGELRWISQVEISSPAFEPRLVDLGPASRTVDGQQIELGTSVQELSIRIKAIEATPGRYGEKSHGVGFAEINTGLGPTREVVQVPSRLASMTPNTKKLVYVFERLRIRGTDTWRSDPEPFIDRIFSVPKSMVVPLTLSFGLDPRASDESLAALFGFTTAANDHLVGDPLSAGWAATDGSLDTSWKTRNGEIFNSTMDRPTLTIRAARDGQTLQITTDTSLSPVQEIEVTIGGRSKKFPVDSDGIAQVEMVYSTGDFITITASKLELATLSDPRTGQPLRLGFGISEVSGSGVESLSPQDLNLDCRTDFIKVNGQSVKVSLSAKAEDLLRGFPIQATSCSDIELLAGENQLTTSGRQSGLVIDYVTIGELQSKPSTASTLNIEGTNSERNIDGVECPNSCVLVFAESFNDAWSTSKDIGDHISVDGGFNGWLVDSAAPSSFGLEFKPQRLIALGIAITLICIVFCLGVLVWVRKQSVAAQIEDNVSSPSNNATDVLAILLALGFVGFPHALIVFFIAGLLRTKYLRTRVHWVSLAASAWFTGLLLTVVVRYIRRDPVPGSAWPSHAENVHKRLILAILIIGWITWRESAHRPRRAGNLIGGENADA